VPGVDHDGVDAVVDDHRLIVSGARSATVGPDSRIYLHAEIPRGPFRREVRLPTFVSGQPRVEVDNGIVRIRVTKSSKSSLPQA
jgi:HSP20 family molecular chaperone IbpA